ncbi:pentapeptide repeat-containing protein [Nostoc sp. FACHB-133]|uniref:pentapeptide repeat-containing protein n=1 Tax=Nostoc sp. FACHB-133 TaxID=2692835 RepID=UPI001683923E|nr:pentapeptide repeat-containing protein [Nostoc sp. FACHB-133]MBD2526534.1 pentapeptide repeat-containing protein [Nostoc sp. FACHB-133]
MPPDYSGQNLRGRSFKSQNLTGANFSKADIRGANFTNAILKDADFRGTKAGLQKYWVISWIVGLFIVAFLSLFTCATTNGSTWWRLGNEAFEQNAFLFGIAMIVMLSVFILITIWKGLTLSLVTIILTLIVLIFPAAISSILNLNEYQVLRRWIQALILAVLVAIFISGIVALTLVLSKIFVNKLTGIVILGFLSGGITGSITRLLIRDGWKYLSSEPIWSWNWAWVDLIWACFWNLILVLLGSYIGCRALAENRKPNLIFSVAIAFAATGGTSFRNADLTDTNFTGAILRNTDFRKANLTRTRFYEAKKLDFARVDHPILANRGVLNLLVTGNGRGKFYAGANLKGANLIGADLKEANLKNADITEATFQGACLDWANLTLAQAVGTNFTSAQMTGACLEAWNIESTTKLDNVDCRFIYLLENPKPETDDRERRPSGGNFQPGEFTKLFQEVLNTVDLIFRNGIDWKAFVNAFQKVQDQNEDTELALQSIENKGDGVVVVKVGVTDGADKEKIHSDFTQNYQLALQAVEEKYKAQLQAKDNEIIIYRQQSGEMAEIVKLLANKPINVQVDNKVENKNMTNSNDASRTIEIGSVGRDFNASGQALNLGDISGTVTNTINELPASPEAEKPGIKELLTQLQAAIEADTNLPQEDKAEALEQVKALAEAGKNPQEGAMQKAAKTAIKILKGTISSLPSATKLVEQCSNLLPLISNFLGLG